MTRRGAWLGDRRAVALQLVLLLGAGVVWVAPDLPAWRGSWKQGLDLCAGATALMGPAAAAAACLAYARLRRSAVSEILLQARRDWLRWLQPALSLWALASLALVVLTLGATSVASLSGVPSYWGSAWILLPSIVVLAAQTAIGAAVGFSSGRPWLAPLAAVLVYSLFLLTAVNLLPEVFSTGGVTGSLGGSTFAPWPVLSPGVAAAGIAVVVLAAAHRPLLLASPWRRLVVAVAAVIGLTGWVLAPTDSDARYTVLADPPLTCAGSRPQVCVFEETPRPLDDLAARMHRQAASLVELDVPLPRFVQSYAGTDGPPVGAVELGDRESRSTVTDDLATDSLVRPSNACAADYGPEPPYLAFEVRHLLGRWLQVRAGLLTPAAGDRDRDWLRSDLASQEAWVRATYRRLTDCAFDELALPDGLG